MWSLVRRPWFQFLNNSWKEFDETWHEVCVSRVYPSPKMAALASEWSRPVHFSPAQTWQNAITQHPRSVSCRPIAKKWPPWSLIGWDFYYFSSSAERILKTLDRKQVHIMYSTSSTFVGFFCRSFNKDGHIGIWLTETLPTSTLHLFNS